MLADKITNKETFLDIIRQVQLPAVQVHVRTREKEEKLEGKMYRELTPALHLPNYKTIHPNANEQSRTMAAFMYCFAQTDNRFTDITARLLSRVQASHYRQETTRRTQQGKQSREIWQNIGRSGSNGRQTSSKDTKDNTQVRSWQRPQQTKEEVRLSEFLKNTVGRIVRLVRLGG